MKRITIAILVTTLLLFAAFTVPAESGRESAGGDYATRAGSPSGIAPSAATLPPSTEFWRLGVTSEDGAAYNVTQGRPVHPAAAFRSNRGTTDVYHIFPAPGTRRTIQAARFCILTRTGTYTDATTLTLDILDYGGTVQHTVSTAGIDMTAAPTSTWTAITLSGTLADLEIAPGEFLAFHFSLGGTPAGNLGVYPAFEVEVLNSATVPDTPTLLAPPNGAVTTTHAITLTWATSAGANGYHVQLDGGDMITTTGTTSPTILATGLHTWTVRAYNSAGPSGWATPWTVEVVKHKVFLPLVLRNLTP